MQGIEFQIINDSEDASKGLEKLSSALENLKSSIGNSGTQLSKAAEGIQQLKNALNDVKLLSFTIKIKSVADSLKPLGEMKFTSVTSFLKQLNNVSAENLERIAAIDFSNLKEAADSAKAVSAAAASKTNNAGASSGNEIPRGSFDDVYIQPETSQRLSDLKIKLEQLAPAFEFAKSAGRGFLGIIQILGSGLKKLGSGIIQTLASKVKSLTSKVKSLAKSMLSTSSSSKTLNIRMGGLLRSFARIAKYRAIRAVIAAITSSIKEGVKNLAQYSQALNNMDAAKANASLSEYAGKLLQVKNAIGAAVGPLLNLLLPAFNAVANVVIKAANAVNQFLAILNRQSTYTRAVYNAVDYAESLDKASKSAKKLKSATMGFDELNIISDDTSGNTGNYGVAYEDMFEEAEIGSNFDGIKEKLKSLADWFESSMERIKNAVASTNFDGASNLAEKLTRIFNNPELEAAISDMAVDMANGLNRMTASIDWSGIGIAIGAGLDLALSFAVGFIYTYDWQALGSSIAWFVNGAIAEIDWKNFGALLWTKFKVIIETLNGFLLNLDMTELAHAASNIVIGFFDSMTETIQSIDWFKLGEQVKEFLINVDWNGVAISTFTAIGSAFGTVTEFLWGLIHDAWKSVVDWWHDVAYEDGQFTFDGLLQGIVDSIASIGTWIKENIFNPFIEGFKSVFGIHSPSTVMAEIGGYLIDGLFEGLRGFGEKIKNWGGNFIQGVKNVLGIHSPSKEFEEIGEYSVAGMQQGFSGMSVITEKFNEQLFVMQGYATSFSTATLEMIQNVLNVFLSSLLAAQNELSTKLNAMEIMFRSMSAQSVSAINDIISSLNAIPRNITTVHTIITESVSSGGGGTKAYASGGFPDEGQLFIAREAGAELVGNIGGHTAVANNDQIVASVAGGVAEANESQNALLREQNELLRAILAKDTGVKLDGKTLLRSTEKAARQRGSLIMAGGVTG